jgi:hypothetical protein
LAKKKKKKEKKINTEGCLGALTALLDTLDCLMGKDFYRDLAVLETDPETRIQDK